MGGALTTRRAGLTSEHWPLLREYLGHSLPSLNECAGVFLGHSGVGDEDGDDEYLPSTYPRYLTLGQFEEVFGMLVADAQPHFAFFEHAAKTVCAHHVFCSLALLACSDLHAKVQFILRLYATDAHGQLPTERRRMLLRDVLASASRVFSLSDPIENDVVSYLEKELLARDDTNLTTCHELYEYCFTTGHISGFLHEIQSAVHELARLRDASSTLSSHSTGVGVKVDGSRLKLLNRGATMLQLTRESLLWSMRAGDLPWFWRQDHVTLSDDTRVCDALRVMKTQASARAVLVMASHSDTCAGFLTLDDFLSFFGDLLPEDAASTGSMGEYMRIQVAKSTQLFVHSSLRSVLATVADTTTSRRSALGSSRYQCVIEGECFFNVILRLACGTEAVAVLANIQPSAQGEPSPESSEAMSIDPLLGRISVFDILEWVLQDLSLLNGKERFVVASFPWFYYTPATLEVPWDGSGTSSRPWLLNAIMVMKTQGTTGVLVVNDADHPDPTQRSPHVLSANVIREVYATEESLENDGDVDHITFPPPFDALTPLHVLLTGQPHAAEQAYFVTGDDSLAHTIHTMVATHSRRLYIQDAETKTFQGVIRATDILRLLLQEQHCQSRAV